MAKQAERKEETRRRMLDAASRGFRSRGFAGIGVDAIARDAGATSGAFYAHLGSKAGAFSEALGHGLDEVIDAIPAYQKEHGHKWMEAFAAYYLGKPHRDDLACGCAMTALSPEVVRSDTATRRIYQTKMTDIATLIAAGLEGASAEIRLRKAWGLISILIGALTMARAMESDMLAEAVAAAAQEAAVAMSK